MAVTPEEKAKQKEFLLKLADLFEEYGASFEHICEFSSYGVPIMFAGQKGNLYLEVEEVEGITAEVLREAAEEM